MRQHANSAFAENDASGRHQRLEYKAWNFLKYVLGPQLYRQLGRRGYIEVGDFILSKNGHLYGLEGGRLRGYGLITHLDLRGDQLVSLYLWAKSQPNKIKSIACYATPPAPSEVSSAFQARVLRLLQELIEAVQESTPQCDEESLQIYRREIARVKPISKEEELELARRAASGDQQAREKLIAANLKLVVSVAERYQNRGLPLADLIQEGNIGLVKALERFDYTKGCRFAAYAYWWVLNSILQAIGEYPITLPAHAVEGLRDLALLDGKYIVMTSLERSHNGASESLEELLEADETALEEDKQPRPSRVELLRRALDQVELTQKERGILKWRYGLNGDRPHTLKEVAQVFNITRERVRQIELRAIEKLRHPSRRCQLQHFELTRSDSSCPARR